MKNFKDWILLNMEPKHTFHHNGIIAYFILNLKRRSFDLLFLIIITLSFFNYDILDYNYENSCNCWWWNKRFS